LRDVERAGDAGSPLQADLPELAADVPDERLFDVDVLFNVSTVHGIGGYYARCGIE
jgi:hypothetical protein